MFGPTSFSRPHAAILGADGQRIEVMLSSFNVGSAPTAAWVRSKPWNHLIRVDCAFGFTWHRMLLTPSSAGQQTSKSPPAELDTENHVGTDVSPLVVKPTPTDSNDTQELQGSLGLADASDASCSTRHVHQNVNHEVSSGSETQPLSDTEHGLLHLGSSSLSASDSRPGDTITESTVSVSSIIPLTTGPLSVEETRRWQVYGILTKRVMGSRIRLAQRRRAARRAQDDLKSRIIPLIESIGVRDMMEEWDECEKEASELAREEDVLATNEAQLLRFIPHKVNLRSDAQFDDLPRDEIDFAGSEVDYDEELDDLARSILLNNEKESAIEDRLLRLNHKFNNLFDVAIDPSTNDTDRDRVYAELDELDLIRKDLISQLDEIRMNRELVQDTLETDLPIDPMSGASPIQDHFIHPAEVPLPPSPTISEAPLPESSPFSPNAIPFPPWPAQALNSLQATPLHTT
jgi:hypothetical protein